MNYVDKMRLNSNQQRLIQSYHDGECGSLRGYLAERLLKRDKEKADVS